MHTFAHKPKAIQQAMSANSVISKPANFEQSRVGAMLHLQRTVGNQAVQRVLQAYTEQPEAELT